MTSFRKLFLLACVSLLPRLAHADTYETLADFYQATHGPNWTRQDNWLSRTVPVCEWHGVVCNAAGDVTELQLYDNYLEGQLPNSVCDLPQLETLYLSFNQIGGVLPATFDRCTHLKNLWLKANRIEGEIPENLCDGGPIDYIDLHANGLSGSIPATLSRCTSATTLRLDDNHLSGSIPETLWSLPKLRELHLERNELTGTLASLRASQTIEHLYLAHNRLSGGLPSALGDMRAVVTLRLEHNSFSGVITDALSKPPHLQVLRLDHNQLEGDFPQGFERRADALQVCDVSHNRIDCAAVRGCNC